MYHKTTTKQTHYPSSLRWRHNERDNVSNHQPHDCLLNRLFRRRSNKTSKLRVTGLCAGNSPVPGEFPAQMASYAENISIWWRHHVLLQIMCFMWHWPTLSSCKTCMLISYLCKRIWNMIWIIPLVWCRTAVAPVRQQWRYCSIARSHGYHHSTLHISSYNSSMYECVA